MKQFNLKEYLANPSRKVVTRDGRNVRIKCTDTKGDCPVIRLVDCEETEIPISFTEKGRAGVDGCGSLLDLFFDTKKHEGLVNIYRDNNAPYCGYILTSEKEAKIKATSDAIATAKIECEE